jgi:hypothetical protein
VGLAEAHAGDRAEIDIYGSPTPKSLVPQSYQTEAKVVFSDATLPTRLYMVTSANGCPRMPS